SVHTCMRESSPPEAIIPPSGENARAMTGAEWQRSTVIFLASDTGRPTTSINSVSAMLSRSWTATEVTIVTGGALVAGRGGSAGAAMKVRTPAAGSGVSRPLGETAGFGASTAANIYAFPAD